MIADPLALVFLTAGVTTILLRKAYARHYLGVQALLSRARLAPAVRIDERHVQRMNVVIGLVGVALGVWFLFP